MTKTKKAKKAARIDLRVADILTTPGLDTDGNHTAIVKMVPNETPTLDDISITSTGVPKTEDEAFLAMIEQQQVDARNKPEPPAPTLPYCQKDLLAIVGTADTMMAAPYTDENFEIWSVAQAATFPAFKRYDVLYELHTVGYWRDDPIVLKRLRDTHAPIMVMQEQYEEIPGSVRYPIEEIVKYRRYHTTSITYMLAWALHSFLKVGKPRHVAIFGVHMAAREEYTTQRPCCEYWLARLEQAGIDITLAGGKILAATGLYGYEHYDPACWKMRQRMEELRNGLNQRAQEEANAELKKHEQIGALKQAEWTLRELQTGNMRAQLTSDDTKKITDEKLAQEMKST